MERNYRENRNREAEGMVIASKMENERMSYLLAGRRPCVEGYELNFQDRTASTRASTMAEEVRKLGKPEGSACPKPITGRSSSLFRYLEIWFRLPRTVTDDLFISSLPSMFHRCLPFISIPLLSLPLSQKESMRIYRNAGGDDDGTGWWWGRRWDKITKCFVAAAARGFSIGPRKVWERWRSY